MRGLLAAAAAGLVLVGAVTVHQEASVPPSTSADPPGRTADAPVRPVARTIAPTSPPAAVRTTRTPETLVIDAIGVEAPVEPVGITPEGGQEVPRYIDIAGWWRDGAVPGAHGNAVLVGHTASAADGVFDRIGRLAPGDEIRVSGPDGTVTFVVEDTSAVSPRRFRRMAPAIYRHDGPSGLVLMTCGDWNGTSFESTVVVRARRS